jgi:cytochrome P450
MTISLYDDDVFTVEAILDPWPHYAALRELGPVVRLGPQDVLAVTRYDDVRAVLADHETFISGEGVLFSDIANELTRGTTLASDPPLHNLLRKVVAHRLTPRALREQVEYVATKAREVIQEALRRQADEEQIDGVADIAQAMPLAVVPDFIGFPDDARARLLTWARAGSETGGPVSERTPAAAMVARELGAYAESLVASRQLLPGTLGADVLAAADRGEVELSQCPALLIDYFGPALETTISAIGSALALFAQNPKQWQMLRERPELVAAAFNEVVRLESPLRAFTRVAARDAMIDGVPVPAGSRVAVFFASANLDERKWDRPERFDITRDNADHLGLGYGIHGCAGQGLARLEFTHIITGLADQVDRIEFAGTPQRAVHSMLRAWDHLPLRLHTTTLSAEATA